MRLNPHFPNIMFQFLGQSHFMLGQFDEAIEAFERRIIRNPCTDSSHVWLAAIYGHQGRIEEARAEWDKALAVNPNYSLDERIKTWPYRNPADRERVVEGLRQAGLA
jgi:tetratricopeptide (TPR) repeat protein